MPPNFTEKAIANSHKTSKFAKVFSLESFPLYGSKTWQTYYHFTPLQYWYTWLFFFFIKLRYVVQFSVTSLTVQDSGELHEHSLYVLQLPSILCTWMCMCGHITLYFRPQLSNQYPLPYWCNLHNYYVHLLNNKLSNFLNPLLAYHGAIQEYSNPIGQ